MKLRTPPKKVVCPHCDGHGNFGIFSKVDGSRLGPFYKGSTPYFKRCEYCHGTGTIWKQEYKEWMV